MFYHYKTAFGLVRLAPSHVLFIHKLSHGNDQHTCFPSLPEQMLALHTDLQPVEAAAIHGGRCRRRRAPSQRPRLHRRRCRCRLARQSHKPRQIPRLLTHGVEQPARVPQQRERSVILPDLPLVHHEDAVVEDDGGQAVRHRQDGAPHKLRFQCLLGWNEK